MDIIRDDDAEALALLLEKVSEILDEPALQEDQVPDTLRAAEPQEEEKTASEQDSAPAENSLLDKIPTIFKIVSYIPDIAMNGSISDREAREVFEKFRFELLSKMMLSNFGMLTLAEFLSQYHDDEKVKNLIFDGIRKTGPRLGWTNSEIEDSILVLQESLGKETKNETIKDQLISSYMLKDDYVRKSKEIISQLKKETASRPVIRSNSSPVYYDEEKMNLVQKTTSEVKSSSKEIVYDVIENAQSQIS